MSLVDTALALATKGKPIFPVAQNKKPLVEWKPYQERIPTSQEVKEWWGKWPDANIGMATGHLSGWVIIDCDSEEAANRFIEEYPEAKDTLQVQTGRGKHYYFEFEEGIRNDAGKLLGLGIDIRGEGGFVIIPSSIHANGKPYRWLNKIKPIKLPDKLREILISRSKDGDQPKTLPPAIEGTIRVGERNPTLTSLAGTMRRRGMSESAILAALREENATKCESPLEDSELECIAKSVARYAPAEAKGRNGGIIRLIRLFRTPNGNQSPSLKTKPYMASREIL